MAQELKEIKELAMSKMPHPVIEEKKKEKTKGKKTVAVVKMQGEGGDVLILH